MNELLDFLNTSHFGKVDKPILDWRAFTVPDEDDDNDEDFPTTEDVKKILGFDPDDLKE